MQETKKTNQERKGYFFNLFTWLKDKIDDLVFEWQTNNMHKSEIKKLRKDAYYRQLKGNVDEWAKHKVEEELKKSKNKSVNKEKYYIDKGFTFSNEAINGMLIGKNK